jgi:hydrogenase expression/formation protein HypD
MDKDYIDSLLHNIKSETRELALMEVCGTHTMAIARSGIRSLLPKNLRLLSGPGCPVCVTAQGDIDAVIDLAERPGITLVTFGDMLRVPGTNGSLQDARSRGADVRIAYSPLDALALARQNPELEVVFLGIGFETTAPAVAVTLEQARKQDIHNFSVFSLHKVVPPALEAIFSDPDIKVDGLICPGHVSIVIGLQPYLDLAAKHHRPCVVTGFETRDILEGIVMLLQQIRKGEARAEIQYKRVVKTEGNLIARETINRVFTTVNSRWRGLGLIEASGLEINREFEEWDARRKFNIPEYEDVPIKGCACGQVLTGKITPHACPLFGKACTPVNPVGPCMVSHEGTCAAYYRYRIT